MVEITGLFLYPVKGLRGISVQSAELTTTGLRHDRNWMIVMPNGRMVTQRQKPQLAQLSAQLTEQHLVIGSEDQPALRVPLQQQTNDSVEVTVWRDSFSALDTGAEASEWLTRVLGSNYPLRLVAMDDRVRRPQSKPELLGDNTHTAFADSAPFLMTNEASLETLNEQLMKRGAEPAAMDRFRPNIVVKGLPAFAEYQSRTLAEVEGRYKLGLKYPSERCVVITTDQLTGEVEKESREPLNTLKSMNTAPGYQGAYFGENSMLEAGLGETIFVGDVLK